MKLLSYLVLFSILFTNCKHGISYSSKWKYKKKYENQIGSGSHLLGAGYHYTVEKTRDDQYVYKQYYPATKQLLELSTYNDPFLKIRDGKYIVWLDDGTRILEGNYKSDQKDGVWKEYDIESGELLSEVKYNSGEQESNSVDYYANSEKTEKENIATLYYYGEVNETPYTQHIYNDPGLFYLFGAVWSLNNYKVITGSVETGKLNNPTSHEAQSKHLEKPYLPECKSADNPMDCSTNQLIQWIEKELEFPSVAGYNGIEGVALIKIVLDEEGSLKEGDVIRGICGLIEAECAALFDDFPEFEPAKREGVPVPYTFYFPVSFQLYSWERP